MPRTFYPQPDTIADYRFDFSALLETDETITSAVFARDAPLEVPVGKPEMELGADYVTAWITNGDPGGCHELVCTATTSQGRVWVATMVFKPKRPTA